jgi:hypothetical protein
MSDDKKLSDETRMLAAMAYGEGSTDDDMQEMYALASVLRRQQLARGYASIKELGVQSRVIISLFEAGHCSEQGM